MTPIAKIDPDKRLRLQTFLEAFRFASLVAALTLFSAPPSYANAWYSGASVGSDGTVHGWGVTDVTSYTMRHDAYVSAKLTSPKGRVAWLSEQSRQNYIREDVSLAFDPNDLGTFVETGTHRGYCYAAHVWIILGVLSQATANEPSATVNIVGGNNFVLWGTAPSITAFNKQQAQGYPSGGQYKWSASNTRVSFDNPQAALPTLTANSPSTALLDTLLTVNYSYNQQPATPATRYVTVRIYKYLQQSGQIQVIQLTGPSQYGYIATAFYNIFTNPGGQQVPSGFSNVPINEIVSNVAYTPSNLVVTLHQGVGATYPDSEIHDDLSIVFSQPPPPFHISASQDVSVAGIFVRNNTLNWYNNGPTITNNGPFN